MALPEVKLRPVKYTSPGISSLSKKGRLFTHVGRVVSLSLFLSSSSIDVFKFTRTLCVLILVIVLVWSS